MPEITQTSPGQLKAQAIMELVGELKAEIDKHFDKRDVDFAQRIANRIKEDLPAAVALLAKENPDFHLPGAGEGKGEEFSFAAAALAIAQKNPALAPYEFECFKEMNKRFGDEVMRAKALNTGLSATPDNSEGQFLVPEQHLNEIIDLLYAESVAFQLGARAMPGQFGEITIPVLLTSASAAWVLEGVASAESEPSFGEHTMRPRQLMAIVRVGNVLLTNSRPTAEMIIRDNLAEQFRIAMDTAILNGSGTGAEPTGLLNATAPNVGEGSTGAVDMTTIGNPWTYAAAMEYLTDLANENALRGRLGWAMSPTDWSEAVQMSSGTSGVDVTRLVVQDGPSTFLLGYPIKTTTTLAHTGATGSEETIIFGDWGQVRVPFWKTLELRASDVAEDVFKRNQTLVRGLLYSDVSFDHLQSFSIGTTAVIAN